MIKRISQFEKIESFFLNIFDSLDFYPPQMIQELKENLSNQLKIYQIMPNSFGFYIPQQFAIKAAVFGCYNAGVYHIDWIGVSPECQKQGLASQLISELEKYNNLYHKITADVIDSNLPSLKLFQNLNYQQEAFYKKHWYGSNFIQFAKILGDYNG